VRAAWEGDVAWSFRHSPVAIVSLAVFTLCVVAAVFAPLIAPHNPFDLRTLSLSNSLLPPGWVENGKAAFALGTDDQGRDVLSAIMFGARISLLVGIASVVFAIVLIWQRQASKRTREELAARGLAPVPAVAHP